MRGIRGVHIGTQSPNSTIIRSPVLPNLTPSVIFSFNLLNQKLNPLHHIGNLLQFLPWCNFAPYISIFYRFYLVVIEQQQPPLCLESVACTEKTIFPFPFTLNGIWSLVTVFHLFMKQTDENQKIGSHDPR